MKQCNYNECTETLKWAEYCGKHYSLLKRRNRIKMLTDMKGGRCVVCGSIERLEFDHVDPTTKLFDIAGGLLRKMETILDELDKCQLLCRECHIEKSSAELRITRRLFMQKRGKRGRDNDVEDIIGRMTLGLPADIR